MGTGINLIQAWQIIIVDFEYTLYAKEQVEKSITRIRQINYITVYFLVCYDVEIKKRIKCPHCKQAKLIKGIVQTEIERGGVSQSSLANQVKDLISLSRLAAIYKL